MMRLWLLLLVISVSLNVWLWFDAGQGKRAPAKPVVPRGLRSIKLPPSPIRVPVEYAQLDRETLERQLVEVERQIDQLIPPDERFALAERSIESESLVKPYLEQVFRPLAGPEPKYRVECRSRVCRVDPLIDPVVWQRPLQRLRPGREMFRTVMITYESAFLELVDGAVDGRLVARGIVVGARHALNACGDGREATVVDIEFRQDTTHSIRVVVVGRHSVDSFGDCVRAALEQSMANGFVPREMDGFPFGPFQITVPDESSEL